MERISIYIGNHVGYGITDQIDWMFLRLKNTYQISTSETLELSAHNIIIENFNDFHVQKLYEFYERGGQFSILLTENFYQSEFNLVFNNVRSDEFNDYMPDASDRFLNLCKLAPLAKCLIAISDIPIVQHVRSIFPNLTLVNFNELPQLGTESKNIDPLNDFVFFGKMTEFRKNFLLDLETEFSIDFFHNVEVNERNSRISNAKFNLHIPPTNEWVELSPMRIYAAAKCGRKTVILNKTIRKSQVSKWCDSYILYSERSNLRDIIDNHNHLPSHNTVIEGEIDLEIEQFSLAINSFGS